MNELAQPDTPLAASERRDFTRLDKVVHKGLAQFVEVGRALKEIRDRKLYRETFGTFEEYLKQRHDLSRGRGYHLIDAAGLISDMSTIVDKTPANEGQCRELLKLPDGDRQSVWQEVIERADDSGEAITAKMIREVAAPYLPDEEVNGQSSEAMCVSSPVKIHGGKGGKRDLAKQIVALMPPRSEWHLYREPFAGGLSVLLRLDPTNLSEAVNDLDGGLTNFWKVLQSRETFDEFQRRCEATPFSEQSFRDAQREVNSADRVTGAWAFFVLVRQSRQGLRRDFATPTRRLRRGMNENVSAWLSSVDGLADVHARLMRVEVLCMDAVPFIRKYDAPEAVFYCDPPYLSETRFNGGGEYTHEMTNEQHAEQLTALSKLSGRFLLSGYRSALYDDLAATHSWDRTDIVIPNSASSRATKERKTECVWNNFKTVN